MSLHKKNHAEVSELVLSSIMSAKEYSHIRHLIPYTFDITYKETKLRYFGSPHVSDPQNPLFGQIEAAFYETNPDIVIVEGVNGIGDKVNFNEHVRATTRRNAIEQDGEVGFTLKLAVENEIEWRSPEPTYEDLYQNLLAKGFYKDQVFAWDVFRILPQYNRQMNRQGFKQYVVRFIERFKQTTNWENFNYSYERAIELGEQILGRSIDVENEPEAIYFIEPVPREEKLNKQTILNRIGQQSSLFRDREIVRGIVDALMTHRRVFVVYGVSHAVMQEPAFRKLLAQEEGK